MDAKGLIRRAFPYLPNIWSVFGLQIVESLAGLL